MTSKPKEVLFFSQIFRGKFADKIFNFEGIANFFLSVEIIVKKKIIQRMVNAYNSAILFVALDIVQTKIFAICSKIMTDILKVWQP